jgi:hypothetical protein
MAMKIVATKEPNTGFPSSEQDLWLSCGHRCLTVGLGGKHLSAPPDAGQLTSIHDTITGLAKAVEIIANSLEAGEAEGNGWNVGLALNGLADAIVLHTTLAEGINNNLHPDEAPRAQGGAA